MQQQLYCKSELYQCNHPGWRPLQHPAADRRKASPQQKPLSGMPVGSEHMKSTESSAQIRTPVHKAKKLPQRETLSHHMAGF